MVFYACLFFQRCLRFLLRGRRTLLGKCYRGNGPWWFCCTIRRPLGDFLGNLCDLNVSILLPYLGDNILHSILLGWTLGRPIGEWLRWVFPLGIVQYLGCCRWTLLFFYQWWRFRPSFLRPRLGVWTLGRLFTCWAMGVHYPLVGRDF